MNQGILIRYKKAKNGQRKPSIGLINCSRAKLKIFSRPEFFGKFGKILKVAVGTAQAINNSTPPTHTAYVTFARCEDALRAIQAVNNMVVEGRLLKASLGTTKYCSSFLKGQTCYKPVFLNSLNFFKWVRT